MTPNDIEILIHCHVSPSRHPRRDAPAVREALNYFLKENLIKQVGDDIYSTTDKGAAHIQQLCNLPLPTMQFVGYDGRVISDDNCNQCYNGSTQGTTNTLST